MNYQGCARFDFDLQLISDSVSVIALTNDSLGTSNSILAIYMNGRFGNNLFEIASGVAIAKHYKVSNSKLDQTNPFVAEMLKSYLPKTILIGKNRKIYKQFHVCSKYQIYLAQFLPKMWPKWSKKGLKR